MGVAYEIYCNKCGYGLNVSFGVGMGFPHVYEETINDAREGKLGEKIQTFLREHPDGAIDCSLVLAQCIYCGQCENVLDLTMYLPKENAPKKNSHQRWSVAMPFIGAEYVSPWDLENYYKAFAEDPHTCKHCGGAMKVFSEEYFHRHHKSGLKCKCPNCRGKLNIPKICPVIMWD